MAVSIGNAVGGRAGTSTRLAAADLDQFPILDRARLPRRTLVGRIRNAIRSLISWMIRGYQQSNAGDLAAAVAFNAMVALIPTFLLSLAIAGLFLQLDQVLTTTVYASFWGLPSGAAGDALNAALTAKRSSGWLGAISLAVFAWTGAGFVGCLSRSMNRIYGVPGCGYMCEKRRGFFVITAFAALFTVAVLSSTIPTLFVYQDLPAYFENWALAATRYQVLGYLVALVTTAALFAMLYRVVPNAGQRLRDVWPGTITAASLFVLMVQAFPIYLRVTGGGNRYGAVFGLLSLLVGWFYVLSHVILFGTYVNATHQRRRRWKQIGIEMRRNQRRRAGASR
jgi:membrane protein